MPIYNVAPYVERALLSALNQTFESIEFLLVDDRGTDNSMEIVRRIVEEHPRGKNVRIIQHEHNIGTGATKNTAIANAGGEYLFFMDSDDEITPNCIEVLYNAMIETPVDFVVASLQVVNQKKEYQRSVRCEDVLLKGDLSLAEYIYKKEKEFYIATWNKLYNLNFLRENKISCYPHHVNEDMIFSAQIIYAAKSCRLLSVITLYYYQTPGSTCDKQRRKFNHKNAKELLETFSFYTFMKEKYFSTFLYKYYIAFLVKKEYNNLIKLLKSEILTGQEKRNYLNKMVDIADSFQQDISLRSFSVKNRIRIGILGLPFCLQHYCVKIQQFYVNYIGKVMA